MITRIFRFIPQCPARIFPATLAALLTLATPVRAAIPPAENLLPSDTLLLITVPDFSTLRAAGKQSPQWLFWNDAAMKPFHDKFMAKWNEKLVAPLERDLGVKFSDFTGLPQGQLTLAVTQNGWTGGDGPAPGVLLLLDAKGRSDLLKTNLAALRKKWADAGKPMHNETIRGISFPSCRFRAMTFRQRSPVFSPDASPSRNWARRTNRRRPAKLSSASLNRC